jgi:hypothetical protein
MYLNARTESNDELTVVRNSRLYRVLKDNFQKIAYQKRVLKREKEALRMEILRINQELARLRSKLNNP